MNMMNLLETKRENWRAVSLGEGMNSLKVFRQILLFSEGSVAFAAFERSLSSVSEKVPVKTCL